jgi:hypothetical protein
MPSPSQRGEADGVAMTSISILPMIRTPHGHEPGLPVKMLGAIVALWAALAACPAPAQDAGPAAAPAGGGDAPQAAGSPGDGAVKGAAAAPDGAVNRSDIDPVTPMHGAAGLQRRAYLKALIANAPARPAGAPGHTRAGALLAHPAVEAAAPRNAIGIAMPVARSPGRDSAGVATEARVTAPGSAGSATHQMSVPTNAGAALHGAGVNGTAMGRVVSGPASVGGPAGNRSGINGTVMRPRF